MQWGTFVVPQHNKGRFQVLPTVPWHVWVLCLSLSKYVCPAGVAYQDTGTWASHVPSLEAREECEAKTFTSTCVSAFTSVCSSDYKSPGERAGNNSHPRHREGTVQRGVWARPLNGPQPTSQSNSRGSKHLKTHICAGYLGASEPWKKLGVATVSLQLS